MAEKLLPDVVEKRLSEDSVEITADLAEDLFWFRGHFPAQKILPGVAQLEWVRAFAAGFLGPVSLRSVVQMKFVRPMTPGERVRVTVSGMKKGEIPQDVRFRFEVLKDGEPAVSASLGRLRLEVRG